jgi:phage terminase large subunit GpA-like protein
MLARLDNLPPRHCSVTLHATAPEVDFRSSLRPKESPVAAIRARAIFRATPTTPPAIGGSLADIAGTARSWRRPSRAERRDWHIACGNCGNCEIPAAAVPRRAARLAYRLRKLRELRDPRRPSRAGLRDRHITCGNCGNCEILAAAVPARAARLGYRLRKLRERRDPGGGRPRADCEVGISLAEIAGTARSWRRPSRAGPRGWRIACGNCGNDKIPAVAVPRWARDWQNASGNCRNPAMARPLARIAPQARDRAWAARGPGVR